MATLKTELAQHRSKKKREKQPVFERIPFSIKGKKSCHCDEKTVLFIDENQSCEIEVKRYWEKHQTYSEIYAAASGGRKKKLEL